MMMEVRVREEKMMRRMVKEGESENKNTQN